MARTNGAKARLSSVGKGMPTPQILLIELKQRILASLNKLADRDTQHIAVEDLERIAATLSPDGISLFLSCLYETDHLQKSAVRRECVKLFGVLASLHDDQLASHLNKIVVNITKRLRDPDSSVRDACVDAMGTLASKVIPMSFADSATSRSDNVPSITFPGPLGVFIKPLLEALREQSRGVQVGAAMCLARVIDNFSDPPLAALQRLCSRVISLLNSPSFSAKAALLSVISSVVQAGGPISYQCLAAIMACVEDCMKCNDWATRKAASETLGCMAFHIGHSLGPFKLSALNVLESCRFDKVKPVRDTVLQTLEEWKRIPSSELISDPRATGKDCSCEKDQTKNEDSFEEAGAMRERACQNNSSDEPLKLELRRARSEANKICSDVQKKPRSQLIDKKASPLFFQNADKKEFNDWQLDIILPRAQTDAELEFLDAPNSQGIFSRTEGKSFQAPTRLGRCSLPGYADTTNGQACLEPVCSLSREVSSGMQALKIANENLVFDDNFGMSMKNEQSAPSQCTDLVSDDKFEMSSVKNEQSTSPSVWFDQQVQNDEGFCSGLVGSSCSSASGRQTASIEIDSSPVQKHLHQIVSQQANLMDLLKEFINSSQETFVGLDSRLSRVETVVHKLVIYLNNGISGADSVPCHEKFLADENLDSANGKCDGDNVQCCCKLFGGADILSSKFWKKSENRRCAQGRSLIHDSSPSAGIELHDIPLQNSECGNVEYERFRHGSTASNPLTGDEDKEAQADSLRVHFDLSCNRASTRKGRETEGSLHVKEKSQEHLSGFSRHGIGHHARKVWHSSKDTVTLAPLRIVEEDSRANVRETSKNSTGSKWSALELRSGDSSQRLGGQGQNSFWSLWTRAAECLQSGDVNSAYVEVLCSGDELLLVRLMSRTGPVLEQLSSGTVEKLLRIIIQLLLQQSFLDVMVPWVQQVADLVTSNSAACGGLSSLDNKRELVASLEEASTFEVPISKTLGNLAAQLSSIWGITQRKEFQGHEN